jgi:superfamily II DNA or RNA helicase
LTNDPVYRREVRRVWLWDEWPGRWGADCGIDLVAEDQRGGVWAIQAKAYDPRYGVKKADIDTFLSESARPEISFRLLIATTDRLSGAARRTLAAQEKPASVVGLTALEGAAVQWPRSASVLRAARVASKRPRSHQRDAVEAVCRGFESSPRGQLIMACGTGKTMTGIFIAERVEADRTLVLVPSLSLVAQTLREWAANSSREFAFLAVCSDDTVAEDDGLVSSTSELGSPVTTDAEAIARFLRQRSTPRVVFATYQSSPRIAGAYALGRVPGFDLVIADEAHRCAGRASSEFATVLDARAIPAKRRLFMTATPRYFSGRVLGAAAASDFEVVSMDDPTVFGPVFHRLSFGQAITNDLLCDYQVVVIGVDDATYRDWAEHGRFVALDGTTVTDARSLAGQIGLVKAMRRFDLRRMISFHSRVARARSFSGALPAVLDWMPADHRPHGSVWAEYVSGTMPTALRKARLDRLRDMDANTRGLLSNARCLAEGVDVPTLDGIAFLDARRSEVDIVQAVGRAIRRAPDKKIGTVVIPVFIADDTDPATALDDSLFKPVWDVIKALRAHDDSLAEELDSFRRQLGRGESLVGLPAKIQLDLPVQISSQFATAFKVRLVESTTATWEYWYGLLETFVQREGHARVPKEYEVEGFNLGAWAGTQRRLYAKGRLDRTRVERLAAFPGWAWNQLEDHWEQGFAHLVAFSSREAHTSVPQGYLDGEYRLGQWVAVQRSRHAKQGIDAERVARLESLPGWSWTPRDERWEDGYAHLLAYVERTGHTRVPRDHRDEDGYPVGRWVTKQRHLLDPQADDEHARRLEALPGWSWDPYADAWEQGFTSLVRFTAREGHSRVPQQHIEDGRRLGSWVANQRTAHANHTLDTARVQRLETVPGWTWDHIADRWTSNYTALVAFAEQNGHARVPVDYAVCDNKLGRWARTQRVFHADGRLGHDRVKLLEALPGWSWDPYADAWEQGFTRLCAYAAREGHTRVPRRYAENGVNLGDWVGNQRASHRRGELSPERIAQLETLPGWTWRAPKGPRPRAAKSAHA